MGRGSFAYNLVLVIHIVAVVVAFGIPISRTADVQMRRVADIALYTIPIWGMALIGMSNKVYKFTDLWLSASLLLWFVIVGVTHALLVPARERLEDAAQTDRAPLAQRLKVISACVNVTWVVVVGLMVWQPGT